MTGRILRGSELLQQATAGRRHPVSPALTSWTHDRQYPVHGPFPIIATFLDSQEQNIHCATREERSKSRPDILHIHLACGEKSDAPVSEMTVRHAKISNPAAQHSKMETGP